MVTEAQPKSVRVLDHGGAVDTLVALIEIGPLWDGDIPSRVGRDLLIEAEFVTRIVGPGGEQGWQAATYKGYQQYLLRYDAKTVNEAKESRLARRGKK